MLLLGQEQEEAAARRKKTDMCMFKLLIKLGVFLQKMHFFLRNLRGSSYRHLASEARIVVTLA